MTPRRYAGFVPGNRAVRIAILAGGGTVPRARRDELEEAITRHQEEHGTDCGCSVATRLAEGLAAFLNDQPAGTDGAA